MRTGAAHQGTLRVSVDLIPNRRFIIYLLDFPSRLLADRLVHARLQRWMAWFSSDKIDSDPDTPNIRSIEHRRRTSLEALAVELAYDIVAAPLVPSGSEPSVPGGVGSTKAGDDVVVAPLVPSESKPSVE